MTGKKFLSLCLGTLVSIALISCGGSSSPIGITLSSSTATIDGTNAATFSATVTNDKNAAGVTWSLSGAGALSSQSTTSVTYTAPAATSTSQSATITATSVADATKTGTIAITVPAKLTVVNSPPTALNGAAGTAYSVQIQPSGGIPPYSHFAVATGYSLPACLTLNSSTGVITFTSNAVQAACAAGSPYDPVFTFQDSGNPPLTGTTPDYQITIAPAPPITFGAAPTATATYNVAYSSAVAATGGAGTLTYTKASGSLPPGFTLASNGAITGMPAAADIGTWTFAVTASDGYGDIMTSPNYTIVVSYPQLTVTSSALASGYGNTSYSQTLAASGGSGTGYSWAVNSGAASLTALNLSLSSAGVLSGTPPLAGGTASFVAKVTDSANNTATGTVTLTIKPGLQITTASPLPAGYGNTAYSQTLMTSGGSGSGLTWSVTSGSASLAALNLSLSGGGMLSGTPPVAGGTAAFTVQVTDSASNKATANFTLTINPGVTVTAPSLASAYPGTAYASPAFTASGGSGGFAWSMAAASGSSIPTGFAINPATGVISAATPVNAGSTNQTYNVVVTATDSVGNTGSANVTITIEALVTITTPTTLPAGTVGVNYSQPLAATGGSGTGYTWQLTAGAASLSAVGLSFNTTTGMVSGTSPTQGTASFTVTATDSQSHVSVQAIFTVEINNQLKINQTSLPSGNVGVAYSQTLTASGGSGSGYTYTTTSGNLSTYGLSLASSGAITGTPTQSGTASFTAQVTDGAHTTATQNLTIQVDGALTLTPSSLPTGYINQSYPGTITGSGGSGNLTLSIYSALAPSNGTLAASITGNTLSFTGTPTTATQEFISVTLTDNTTGNSILGNYGFTIATPTYSLPTQNPPAATVGQAYAASIQANITGGSGTYVWLINGSQIASNGTTTALGGSGLASQFYASDTGTGTLSLTTASGVPPSSSGSFQFTAQIKDTTTNLTSGTQNYSITVNSAGQIVSGQISINSNCGGSSGSQPPFTISISYPSAGSPTNTTTDNNGNYSFSGIPNGTYTVTPAIPGASSVFAPATQSVTVSSADVTNVNFGAAIGFTVSGNVNYSGSKTGQIYILLNNNNCGGNPLGTSISAKGAFTINGVPPGTYTLGASMDTLGYGAANTNDPSGSASNVQVTFGNLPGQSVTLNDPSATTLSAGPEVDGVSAEDQSAVVLYKPIMVSVNNNNVEAATSYTVQWSTSSSFGTIAGSKTFPATGDGTDIWIVPGLTNGQVFYFRAQGTAGSSTSPWTVYASSGTAVPVTIGAPTGGNTITGTVTFTGTATGPLYTGFADLKKGIIYAARISNPVSPQAFTVQAPSGSNYFQFGIIDQNNDGIVDAGDISNTGSGGSSNLITISANAVMNLTLPSANSTAKVTTQYMSNTYANGSGGSGTSTNYQLNFDVRAGIKLPVSVELTSGPNVLNPIDLGLCADCGNTQYQYYVNIGGATPNVGDTYKFTVTYSDGSKDTGSTSVNALVTGWNNTSAVVGAADLATSLAPSGNGSSTTPTFTWTDPSNASAYVYQFWIYNNNGGQIWQIPGQNSKLNGFPSSVTSITWGTDPTGDSSNTPSGSLSSGATYNWTIAVQDTNGNQAQTQTYYIP